jgi:hypothetical protein
MGAAATLARPPPTQKHLCVRFHSAAIPVAAPPRCLHGLLAISQIPHPGVERLDILQEFFRLRHGAVASTRPVMPGNQVAAFAEVFAPGAAIVWRQGAYAHQLLGIDVVGVTRRFVRNCTLTAFAARHGSPTRPRRELWAGNRYGLPSGFGATLKPSVSELTDFIQSSA